MLIFKTRKGLKAYLKKHKKDYSLAFIPTMGALHQGHLNLIKHAKNEADLVLVSIYVNPTQFNDVKDLEKYPRNLDKDIELLKQTKIDFAFIPKDQEMYPQGLEADLDFTSPLFSVLEGRFRPGHFAGVCMIVKKFLDLIQPEIAIFGQKDLQQTLVIKELVTFYKIPVKIKIAKIAREKDGLAISSRNLRLKPKQRRQAKILSEVIFETEEELRKVLKSSQDSQKILKKIKSLEKKAIKKIQETGYFELEYFAIKNATDLSNLTEITTDTEIAILLAGWIGKIRLIDNEVIKAGIYFN